LSAVRLGKVDTARCAAPGTRRLPLAFNFALLERAHVLARAVSHVRRPLRARLG
jgi:hypothetical protein